MRKNGKRILAWLLCVVMLASMMPVSAFAEAVVENSEEQTEVNEEEIAENTEASFEQSPAAAVEAATEPPDSEEPEQISIQEENDDDTGSGIDETPAPADGTDSGESNLEGDGDPNSNGEPDNSGEPVGSADVLPVIQDGETDSLPVSNEESKLPEEGGNVPEGTDTEAAAGEQKTEENPAETQEAKEVRVVFTSLPEGALIEVWQLVEGEKAFAEACADPAGDSEENGEAQTEDETETPNDCVYLLLPGDYFFSVTLDETLLIEEGAFTVEEMEEPLTMDYEEWQRLHSQVSEDEELAESAPKQMASENDPYSGSCGAGETDSVTWKFNPDTGVITISGSGAMKDYVSVQSYRLYYGPKPWEKYKDDIQKVVVEAGVTHIGVGAFLGYTALTELDFIGKPDIGQCAFEGCTGLTGRLVLESSFGASAFKDCTGITKLVIRDGFSGPTQMLAANQSYNKIKSTDIVATYGPFYGCINLSTVEVETAYTCTPCLFAGSGITAVTDQMLGGMYCLPRIMTIGTSAFEDCTLLETVNFSGKSIGGSAFSGCLSLQKVTLLNPEVRSTSHDGMTFCSEVFENCAKLRTAGPMGGGYDIEFQGMARTWDPAEDSQENYAYDYSLFSGSNCLKKVVIPDDGLDFVIQARAFKNCTALEEVYYERSSPLAIVRKEAFSNCPSLKSVRCQSGNVEYAALGRDAFSGAGVEEITVTSNLSSVSYGAFSRCNELRKVTFTGKPLRWFILESAHLTSAGPIGSGCSIELPVMETLTGDYLSTALSSLEVPSGVQAVNIQQILKLDVLKIPSSVTSLVLGYSNTNGGTFGTSANIICYTGTAEEWNNLVSGITDPWTVEAVHDAFVVCDYDGGLDFNPGEKDISDAPIALIDVAVYENHRSAIGGIPPEASRVSSGVTITFANDKDLVRTTSSDGIARIPLGCGDVTFSKEGYQSRTISPEILRENSTVILQIGAWDIPMISAIWVKGPQDTVPTDVLHFPYSIIPYTNDYYTVSYEVDWGFNDSGSVKIRQRGRNAYTLNEGENQVQLGMAFDLDDTIEAVATGIQHGNDEYIMTRSLQLTNGSSFDMDEYLVSVGDSIKFEMPEAMQEITGLEEFEYNFYSGLPVTMIADGNKIFVSIGLQWDWKNDTSQQGKKFKMLKYIDKVQSLQEQYDAFVDPESKKLALDKGFENLKKDFGSFTSSKGKFGLSFGTNVAGFVELLVHEDRTIEPIRSGLIVGGTITGSWTKPFMSGGIPLTLKAKAMGEINDRINLWVADCLEPFTPEQPLSLLSTGDVDGKITIKGSLGIGFDDVLGLCGGVAAVIKINGILDGDEGVSNWFKWLRVVYNIKHYGEFGILGFTLPLWEETAVDEDIVMYEYSREDELNPNVNAAASLLSDEYFVADNYVVGSNSIKSASVFLGTQEEGQEETGENAFLTDAYSRADPQSVIFADGSKLAVWIDSVDGESDINSMGLMYSYAAQGDWTTPAPVQISGTIDGYPELTLIDDTAYLIWQNASDAVSSEMTLANLAEMMNIYTAVFDRGSQSFSAVDAVTNTENTLNMSPTICGDGNSVYAVWIRNSENDWFGSGNNMVMYSTMTGSTWSEASTLFTLDKPILGLAADVSDGNLTVACCVDTDGNLRTSDDLEIYSNGTRLTNNAYADSGVFFSGGTLYWHANGVLMSESRQETASDLTMNLSNFQIVEGNGTKALVYADNSDWAATLYVSFYNSDSDEWGSPIAVDSGAYAITYFSASVNENGEVVILMEQRELVITENETNEFSYGNSRLVWLTQGIQNDISVESVIYDDSTFAEGSLMTFAATVKNNGVSPAADVEVTLYNDDGQAVGHGTEVRTIASGEYVQFDIPYYLTGAEKNMQFTVQAEASALNESNTDNNAYSFTLDYSSIAVDNISWSFNDEGKAVISASVINRSYEAVSNIGVYLQENSGDKAIVAQKNIDTIGAFEAVRVSFPVDFVKEKVYLVGVNHEEWDLSYVDDVDYLALHGEDINCAHTQYTEEVTEATCTEYGTVVHICSDCGYTEIVSITPSLGHDWVLDETRSIPATCTEDGVEISVCSRCGEEKTEELSAFGHTTEIRNAIPATDDNDGYTGDEYCTVCGELLHPGEVIPKQKVLITVVSEDTAGTSSVALLTGGGKYARGADVTVSAENLEGYAFLGWYQDSALVSAEYTYRFTPDDDVNLTAVYEVFGTVTLSIVGDHVSINGTPQEGTNHNVEIQRGSTVSLAFNESGNGFLYWTNESNMIESTNDSFSFTIMRDMFLTAVTAGTEAGSEENGYNAYVEFISIDGQVLRTETWNSKDSAENHALPSGPSRVGKVFSGWSLDRESVTDAAGIISSISLENRHLILKPIYEESGIWYLVTVSHGGNIQTWNVKYGARFSVTAMELPGRTFQYWQDENGNILSTQETYSEIVSGNRSLFGVYTANTLSEQETTEPTKAPALNITGINAVSEGNIHKIAFHATRAIPEGYTLNRLLMLVSPDGSFGEADAESRMLVDCGIPQAVSTLTDLNGTLTVNKKVANDYGLVYARAYMLVTGPTGVQQEIYTPIVSASYHDLAE